MVKRCFKCHKEKELEDFYRHKRMADGHLNKCKTCTRKDVHDYHVKNMDKAVVWSGQWKRRHPDAVKRMNAKWSAHPHAKERRACNWAAWAAVRKGIISKLTTCEDCGTSVKRICMHHDDYSKPLDVRWLCGKCHWAADELRRSLDKSVAV